MLEKYEGNAKRNRSNFIPDSFSSSVSEELDEDSSAFAVEQRGTGSPMSDDNTRALEQARAQVLERSTMTREQISKAEEILLDTKNRFTFDGQPEAHNTHNHVGENFVTPAPQREQQKPRGFFSRFFR